MKLSALNLDPTIRKGIVIGLIILIAVLVVVGLVRNGGPGGAPGEGGPLGEDAFRPENPDALETTEGGTREIISQEIETPEAGATSTSEDVAVPVNVAEFKNVALRTFELRGEGGKYIPSIIVVDELDPITIKFTSVDADYKFFVPDFWVDRTIPQGETKDIKFQAAPYGEYQFYCKDVCKKEITGTLIVNQK